MAKKSKSGGEPTSSPQTPPPAPSGTVSAEAGRDGGQVSTASTKKWAFRLSMIVLGVIALIGSVFVARFGSAESVINIPSSAEPKAAATVHEAPSLPTKENKAYITIGNEWVELPHFIPENYHTELKVLANEDYQFKDKDWNTPITVTSGNPVVCEKNMHMFQPMVRLKRDVKAKMYYYCVKDRD